MKKILKKIWYQKYGTIIGLIVGSVTSYAVTSMSSDSFSYTRDGQVKSVKQALDELYTKAYNG